MSPPCAACKYLRRKCTNECVFAPYFPPNQTQRFDAVHKVYGASNVAKILSDLPPAKRLETVTSLVYEAEARLNDPIYGCVGSISILQHKLNQIQSQMEAAKQELATHLGPSAMEQVLNQMHQNPMLGHPVLGTSTAHIEALTRQMVEGARERDMLRNQEHNHQQQPQRQQAMDLLGDGAREQDMLRNLERHSQLQQQHIQHQQKQPIDLLRFNRRFDVAGSSGQATGSGFTQLAGPGAMSPSLAFGGSGSYDSNVSQIQQQHPPPQQELPHHLQHQPMLRQKNQLHPQHEHHHDLQHLQQHQPMVQQQNQQLQLQSHSQEQHHDLHHLITHQPMLQQQTQQPQLQQYPQQGQHDHPTWLLPHQLLLQQQNQPLQPQPQPQQEQHDHIQPRPQPDH